MNIGAQQSSNRRVPTQEEINNPDEINKKQEERIHNLESKALQFMNLYFVFQGVILTSTSTSTSLKCHHWRIPFILSLFATLLNGFASSLIIFATVKAREGLDQNQEEFRCMRHNLLTNQIGGAQLNQVQQGLDQQHQNNNRPRPDSVRKWRRRIFAGLAFGLFVGFSGVILYSSREILCHGQHSK